MDGRVRYKVPAGTQPGTTFRLRGKGVRSPNSGSIGDLFVRVQLEVPSNLTQRQIELLQEFDSNSTDEMYKKKKSFFESVKEIFTGDDKAEAPSEKGKKRKKRK